MARTIKWLFLLIPIMLIAWFCFQQPTHEGNWHPLQTRLPSVELHDTRYAISNIRDFRYDASGAPVDIAYVNGSYDLKHLQRVWLGLSHFAEYGMAHAFLSFEFWNPEADTEPQFLVVSIEARLRPDQGYSPLKGLFQQYHRMVVLGTEEDVIGLRSHVRQEQVYLYELTLPKEHQHYLFHGIMMEVLDLETRPAFYNTVLHNCVTRLLQHDPDYRVWRHLFDYRILLPGYGDAFAQEKGWIRQDKSLDDMRTAGKINSEVSPDVDLFSFMIR